MSNQRRFDAKTDLEDLRQTVYAMRLLTDVLAEHSRNTDLAALIAFLQTAVREIVAILERLELPSPPDDT